MKIKSILNSYGSSQFKIIVTSLLIDMVSVGDPCIVGKEVEKIFELSVDV